MSARVFKTLWFAKAARKVRVSDRALFVAIKQVERGQADDLGGGVFKKRLNENRHRSIILAQSGAFWIYVYLFAKQDRANIEDDELLAFRALAELYRKKTAGALTAKLESGALQEIEDDE